MTITILSVLIITAIVWIINKKLSRQICPICAGVSLTWTSLYLGMLLGKLSAADFELPSAILAGGTVVGLMSKLENSIKPKFILPWKTLFTLSGFSSIYGIFTSRLSVLAAGIILAAATTFLLKERNAVRENGESEQVKAFKEKMKGCC